MKKQKISQKFGEILPKIKQIRDTHDCHTFASLYTQFRATIIVKSAHNFGTKLPNMTQIPTILVTLICHSAWGTLSQKPKIDP